MHFPAILHEIDAEIEKLTKVRSLLASFAVPIAPAKKIYRKRAAAPAPPRPEPTVTVVPPRQKREHTRTEKPRVLEPRALAAPRSDKPVVYMPAKAPDTAVSTSATALALPPETLEAAMRHNLFTSTV